MSDREIYRLMAQQHQVAAEACREIQSIFKRGNFATSARATDQGEWVERMISLHAAYEEEHLKQLDECMAKLAELGDDA